MKTLPITGGLVLCAVAALQSASAATAKANASQLNVYSDSYAPVVSRTITVTAQYADSNGLPVHDNAQTSFTPLTINWSVSNGAYAITSSSTTNALGYATATLTVPATAGQSCTVTASDGTHSATSNTITSIAGAGAAVKYLVTLSTYQPQISTSAASAVSAQLVDANNNPVSAAGTVTWSKNTSNGSFSSATSSVSGGLATVTLNTAAAMTTYVITANDGTYSGSSLPATTDAVASLDAMTTPVSFFIDYNHIQGIFSNSNTSIKCTNCHTSGSQSPYYDPGSSYGNTVGVVGASAGLDYFNPSDAGTSYIFRKVHEGSPPGGGARMPDGGPYLNAAEQQIFRDWINQGCLNRTVQDFQVSVTGSGVPSPAAGTTVTITAQLRDSTSTACSVPGMLVTWTNTGTNGSFSSATSRTDANGLATTTFTTDTVSGRTYTFTATAGSLTGTSTSITTVAGSATGYIVTPSTTSPLAGATQSVTAQLVDQYNNNVNTSGVSVAWTHSSAGSGASFSASPTNTNGSGLATVNFTASTTSNTAETITATTGSVSGTSALITTQSANYVLTITQSAPYTVGETLNITAQLHDSSGNVLQAGHVVTFSASGPGGTFTPSTPQTTDANGQVAVSFTTSTTSGSITITATEGTSTGNTTITNNPGAAAGYTVAVTNSTPTVNTSITANAQLVDAYNNAVSTSGLSVTWSATGQGGTFAANPTTTDSSGHTSVSFQAATTSGATTIAATDTNALTGSTGIVAQAGPAAQYVVSVATSMTAGSAGNAVTAQLADAYGNSVNGSRTVTWSVSGAGGSFSSSTSATNASGFASVTYTASTTAGSAVINAADGTDQGNSSTITINPGPANKYIVTSNTASPVAGSGVTISAQLTDSYGNALSVSGLSVAWTLTAGSGGSFSSPSSMTNGSGIATVTYTTSTAAGTAYTVQASETTHTGSVSFTSAAGTPVACPLLVVPTNPIAGAAVSVTGQIKDANGNNVSTAGIVIIWSSDASGAFSQGTSTSNASGQVSVTFTTGPKANVTYNLTATDGAAISGSAAPFTSQTGAAAAYAVNVTTTSPVAGASVTVSAQLADVHGNAVATAGQTVAWAQTGTGGAFAAPASITDANGLATVSFTTSKVAGTATSFSAATGAFVGSSASVTTISGPAAKYVLIASSTSVSAGTAVRIAAQLTDANGNTVATPGQTVTWAMSGTNGFLSTPSSVTDDSGMATVVLSTSPSGGVAYVVTATDSDGLTGTSPQIAVAAATAATGVSPLITSPLTANTSAGSNFSYSITATGDQPITFDAQNLPAGLTLSGDTISGAVISAGTYVVHITATNAFGSDAIDLVIVAAPLQALSVDRAQVKLNFAASGADALSALFTLTLPDGTDTSNAVVSVQFGGVSFDNMTQAASKARRNSPPLEKGGQGGSAVASLQQRSSESVSLNIKPAVKNSSSLFVGLNVKNASLKDALAANGLVNADVASTVHVPVVVRLTTDAGTFYCGGDAVLQYKARKNKSGLARK